MNFNYKEKNQASKESNFINTNILIDILKKSGTMQQSLNLIATFQFGVSLGPAWYLNCDCPSSPSQGRKVTRLELPADSTGNAQSSRPEGQFSGGNTQDGAGENLGVGRQAGDGQLRALGLSQWWVHVLDLQLTPQAGMK